MSGSRYKLRRSRGSHIHISSFDAACRFAIGEFFNIRPPRKLRCRAVEAAASGVLNSRMRAAEGDGRMTDVPAQFAAAYLTLQPYDADSRTFGAFPACSAASAART